jgi:hypothetical protein
MHATENLLGEKVPFLQSAHVEPPVLFWNFPDEHGVHSTDPLVDE